jgi:hypothetical protein
MPCCDHNMKLVNAISLTARIIDRWSGVGDSSLERPCWGLQKGARLARENEKGIGLERSSVLG